MDIDINISVGLHGFSGGKAPFLPLPVYLNLVILPLKPAGKDPGAVRAASLEGSKTSFFRSEKMMTVKPVGTAYKPGSKRSGRMAVDDFRYIVLLHAALREDHHLIAHFHGLPLIVGDKESRSFQTAHQIPHFSPHIFPELCVQRR